MRNLDIDRLRGVAIAWVLVHHGSSFSPWAHSFTWFNAVGYTGVDLFFVISGFVIGASLIPKIDLALAAPESNGRVHALIQTIKNFFVKRFFRLYPLLWVSLLAATVVATLANPAGGKDTFHQFFGEALAIHALAYNSYAMALDAKVRFFYAWSLSIEEQFYLFFPFLLLILPSAKKRIGFMLGYILLILLIRPLWALSEISWYTLRLNSILRFDLIFAGVLLYLLTQFSWFEALSPKTFLRKIVKFGLPVVFLLLLGMFPLYVAPTLPMHYPISLFLGVALVYLASLQQNLILNLPALGTLFVWLGTRSYAIYLLHSVVLDAIITVWQKYFERIGIPLADSPRWLLYSIELVSLGLVVELAYRYIELPWNRRGHALTTSPPLI